MDQPQPPRTDPPKNTSWHNTIATYMSRHIRHVRAASDEWIRVHRSGGGGSSGGGGNHNWGPVLMVLGIIGGLWLIYGIVSWVIGIVETIVSALFAFLSVALPLVAVSYALVFFLRFFRSK